MKKFSSKRALFLSVLSMVICVSMLIGSTFAWFTDSATANVNTIQAGNLEVDLQIKNAEGNWVSAENTTLDFVKATGAPAGEKTLWEPGCTYQLPELRIVNKGNLALKYQLVITGATGDTMLLDVIKFTATVTPEEGEAVTSDNAYGTTLISDGKLLAGKYATLNISAHMDETANNDYKDKSVSGIAIKVIATQLAHEFDSNGNTYDAGSEFSETIAAGKTFTGKATVDMGIIATNPSAIAVKAIGADADVTINGGFFDGGKGGDNIGVCAASGAKVTINGGTFTVGGDANGYGNSVVYSQGGTIVINGGFFYTNCSYGGRYYVLNQSNGNPGTITVYGGTFVNYDPSTGDDNLGGNFVANGYTVVSETKANGDVWYTVVKSHTVSELNEMTGDELKETKTVSVTVGNVSNEDIAYGEHNTGYTGKGVLLGSTKLNSYASAPASAGEHKFIFKDGTITSAATGYGSIDNYKDTSVYMLVPGNSDVVFENMTFNGVVSFDIQKYTSPWSNLNSITFKNCVFNGIIIGTCPASNVTFDGCKFNAYTNTADANNSNPIWWREDTEGSGANANPIKTFTFVNNTVVGTRPVKIERVGKTVSPTFTFKNNSFDITAQEGDTVTRNMAINIGMGENPNLPFTLIDEGNTVSANTAALYTASLTGGSNWYKEVSGMKVLDGNGNEKVITAMVWKTTTGETFELKSVD